MNESCICVVDNEWWSRQLVADLAAAMLVECRSFAAAEDLLTELPAHNITVVVSEFRLLGMNGIELQRRLKEAGRLCQMIFHSAHAETKLTVEAMQAGAVTVLEKPASEQELWDAIRNALARGAELYRVEQKRTEIRSRLKKLSQRERSVLRLMMEGYPNKSVARQLEVSVRTVENCRHNIFRKSRTDSIAELVRLIVEIGPWRDDL